MKSAMRIACSTLALWLCANLVASSARAQSQPYSLDQINSKVKEVLGKGAQTIQ